jgi:hypothetical protein
MIIFINNRSGVFRKGIGYICKQKQIVILICSWICSYSNSKYLCFVSSRGVSRDIGIELSSDIITRRTL